MEWKWEGKLKEQEFNQSERGHPFALFFECFRELREVSESCMGLSGLTRLTEMIIYLARKIVEVEVYY